MTFVPLDYFCLHLNWLSVLATLCAATFLFTQSLLGTAEPKGAKKLELFGKIDDFFLYKHPQNSLLTIFVIRFRVLPKEKVSFIILQYGGAQCEWSSSLNRCAPKTSSFFTRNGHTFPTEGVLLSADVFPWYYLFSNHILLYYLSQVI